ncbi:polysaccharide pyruvyl transferase family protein [Planktomarina temperata]|nr:polysaccharide pyruvyl transferase family protein [Planktomarina temperata]
MFGAPYHPNLGDLAQTLAINAIVNDLDRKLVSVDSITIKYFNIELINKFIKHNDILLLHSGYHFVDHHPEFFNYLRIAQICKFNRIIVLPQTYNLINPINISKFKDSFSSNRITFIARDPVSYHKINDLGIQFNLRLHPDLVTYFINKPIMTANPPSTFEKKMRIACILRNDLEKKIDDQSVEVELVKNQNISYDVFDTNVTASVWLIDIAKRSLLLKFLGNLKKYDVIVTDRYHGMIFSVLCRKPVIVLPTNDHKIETGAKFLSSHSNIVKYCTDIKEVSNHILELRNSMGDVTVQLPYSDIHTILK